MMNHAKSSAVLALLLLAGCTTTSQPSASPSDSSSPSHSPSSSVQVLAAADCLEFPCEGPLEPGRYRSTLFDPTIEFEVKSYGWTWEYFGTPRSGNFRLVADESHELP